MRKKLQPIIALSVLSIVLTACGGSDSNLTDAGSNGSDSKPVDSGNTAGNGNNPVDTGGNNNDKPVDTGNPDDDDKPVDTGGNDEDDKPVDTGDNDDQQSDQLSITRDNAEEIASSVLRANEITEMSSGLLELTKLFTGITPSNNKPLALKSGSLSSKTQNNLEAPPSTISQKCNPGSIDAILDISTNSNNQLDFQSGDSISIVFNQCSLGGQSMDGSMSMSITALEGDFPNGETMKASMTMEFDKLSTIENGVSSIVNGDLSTTLENSPLMASVTISSTLFEISMGSNKESISNLKLKETIDLSDNSMTFDGMATLASSEMEGNYSFVTTTPMKTNAKEMYPSSGVIKVSANQSSFTLTAVNKTDVKIELDLDGDNTIDDTINTTWAELGDEL